MLEDAADVYSAPRTGRRICAAEDVLAAFASDMCTWHAAAVIANHGLGMKVAVLP